MKKVKKAELNLKFTALPLEGRVFYIIKKEAIVEEDDGGYFKELPFLVYGFLCVEGYSYDKSCVGFRNLSLEISADDLDLLADIAKRKFFNVK